MTRFLKSMWFLGLIALIATACRDNIDLEQFSPVNSNSQVISADGALLNQMFRDEDLVLVPIKIKLSAAAAKAFQVGIEPVSDTINKLIANNTLQNTVLMPSSYLDYPSVINVEYGTDSATVFVGFKLTGIEKYYSKNVAIAFRLINPEKGNTIDPVQNTFVVVIDTKDVTTLEEVHYLSIVNHPGEVFEIPQGNQYNITSTGITIPLGINLNGAAGKPFSVKVVSDTDTINSLIANDARFADAIKLPDYTLDTLVHFKSNVNSGTLELDIPWNVFDDNMTANKKFAIAVRLESSTRHVLQPGKDFVILLLDPEINLDNNSFIFGTGNGLNAQYWTNSQFLGYANDQESANLSSTAPRTAPFASRIDEVIDFGGDGWPDNVKNGTNKLSRDNYSSRWFGWFLAPLNGTYTFYQTRWDDGSRLFFDNKLVVNDFNQQWDKDYRKATVTLKRGEVYQIEAHHRENVGGQQARLEYEVKNDKGDVIYSRRIIQKSQLYSTKP